MVNIVLLGHMGRDEALADRLKGHKLDILGEWKNPGLVEKAKQTGGQFHVIQTVKGVDQITEIVGSVNPDMFITNFDDALAAGVVDALQQRLPNVYLPCPSRAAARVEWDKFYLREIIDRIDPKYNPKNFMATSKKEVNEAIEYFQSQDIEVAIKPRNLTGGKGVKVQGKHFSTHADAGEYAIKVIAAEGQSGVEIQERLVGHEFTLQLFTDGKTIIEPPATYDYPYREDGDEGPGTGGMGAFSMSDGLLPFVSQQDYRQVVNLMLELLRVMRGRNLDYKGILYPTFFKTPHGLKIVEINARGGDPELINILDLMEDDIDMVEVLIAIAQGRLRVDHLRYKKLASAMVYLVSPDYGYKKGLSYDFAMDVTRIKSLGCSIRFAATEWVIGNKYKTVGSSRSVGLSALAPTPWEARSKILTAISSGFEASMPLHFRSEIGDKTYLQSLN